MNKLIACVILTVAALLTGCEQLSGQSDTGPGESSSVTIDAGERARVYIVAEDDVGAFSGIAQKVYGDAKYWRLIAEANPGVDPRTLKPGDELFIPPLPAEGDDE